MNRKVFTHWQPFVRHAAIIAGLSLAIWLMIIVGEHYFKNHPQLDVGETFLQHFRAFYVPLTRYLLQPSFVLGFAAALIIYAWMVAGLFYKYFNMLPPGKWFDVILNPRAIESIPHSLFILTIFYAFLQNALHLRTIMMLPFLVISIPFIYKLLEDVFITAEKEGIVENYLILPISDWKIIRAFLRRKLYQVVLIPFSFFIILMVYWEFLYSSIGIIVARKSAPAVFYTNYNDAILKNYTQPHNYLILLQIGIFTAAIMILLYIIYILKGAKNES